MTHLSIIMATRNSAQYLSEALASIEPACEGENINTEILLADGASSDETLTIAESHPGLRIVSRADGGIYDGMNRAMAAATGDYAIVLNSDDALLPAAVGRALRVLEKAPECAFVSGGALFGETPRNATLRSHSCGLSLEGAMFGIPAINARIFRIGALRDIGPIRTDLGLAADREWMARFACRGMHGCAFDDPLYLYRVHAGSHTISGDRAGRLRVYQAEQRLADALLAEATTDAEFRRLACASRALALLKQRLRHAPTVPLRDLPMLDLFRGLKLAYRWRGKLSGY